MSSDPEHLHVRVELDKDQLDQIARLVAERLQTSILKLPSEVSESLKPFNGWTYRGPISGGDWPIHLETTVTTGGGIRLKILDASGQRWFERVLEAGENSDARSPA